MYVSDIDFTKLPPVMTGKVWHRDAFDKLRNNAYTIVRERDGYVEVRDYDFKKIPRPRFSSPTPTAVFIAKKSGIESGALDVGDVLYNGKYIWDAAKYRTNVDKHDISFEEAATAFNDDFAVILTDDEHSHSEERFKLIGYSQSEKMLLVCHCYRNDDTLIRIISARKASKHERKIYEGAAEW